MLSSALRLCSACAAAAARRQWPTPAAMSAAAVATLAPSRRLASDSGVRVGDDASALAAGAGAEASAASADSERSGPAASSVALATHLRLRPPAYSVSGDVQPVNEYQLAEEFSGQAYHSLPIVYLSAKRNNCVTTLTDSDCRTLATTSAGKEGFRNAKKMTSVAAQVVGVSIALKAKKLGLRQARVVIRGTNPLRLACVQGMASAGLEVVSLTDSTKLHYGKGRRPRKPPRK